MKTNKLIISHSQMSMFETCPRKWHKQYIEGIKPFIGKALHFGRRTHSMIETKLKSYDTKIYSPKDFDYDKKDPEGAFDSAVRLVNAGLEGLYSWEELEFPGTNKLNPGEDIEYRFQLPKFRGVIDLRYTTPSGKRIIVDWKTTSTTYKPHDIKTSPQLTAYAWAEYIVTKKIPDCLAFITLDKTTYNASLYLSTRTLEDIEQYTERVEQNYVQMKQKVSYRKESGCIGPYGKCSFYKQCWGLDEPIIKKEPDAIELYPNQPFEEQDWF